MLMPVALAMKLRMSLEAGVGERRSRAARASAGLRTGAADAARACSRSCWTAGWAAPLRRGRESSARARRPWRRRPRCSGRTRWPAGTRRAPLRADPAPRTRAPARGASATPPASRARARSCSRVVRDRPAPRAGRRRPPRRGRPLRRVVALAERLPAAQPPASSATASNTPSPRSDSSQRSLGL